MNEKQVFGRAAEEMALDYLLREGYILVEKNWRTRTGEIDLIMDEGPTLVFVEVKARRSTAFGSALEALTRTKQLRLYKLVQIYLKLHQHRRQDYRIDFISIQVDSAGQQIDHLKNVVEASY